jgi:hypothetical protein
MRFGGGGERWLRKSLLLVPLAVALMAVTAADRPGPRPLSTTKRRRCLTDQPVPAANGLGTLSVNGR